MKNKGLAAVIVIVLVLAVIVGAMALGNDDNPADNMSEMETSQTENTPAVQENSSQPATVSSQANAVEVEIKDSAYTPATIKVKAGTTVTWTNRDSIKHDVTADDKSDDAPMSELLAGGESYSFTFNKTGTYTYHCTPHSFMKGTVIVE